MGVTRLEIDLGALRHNYAYLQSKLLPGVKTMAVVKAFGYGSDGAAVALELEKLGVYYFAVAYASEGAALREAGVTSPILVLHPQPDNFEMLLEKCLEPSIYSKRVFEEFYAFAKAHSQQHYPIHLKFNTGLNRLGFSEQDVPYILERLQENTAVKVASLFSHLAASEDPNEKEFTEAQIQSFGRIANAIKERLDYVPFLHVTNTSGLINYPKAQLDVVRTGIGFYGYGNTATEDAHLRPVASLKTVISQIHDIKKGESVGYNRAFVAPQPRQIATLPIGHADGISRAFGNGKGYVTIHDQKAPIVGNVCMDMLMVDITHISCQEGDEVVVFGKDVSIVTLTSQINSISYELLTAVSQRVKRVVLR